MHEKQQALSRVTELLGRCGTAEPVLPPTELYNEGWMVRLVLNWLARNRERRHDLSMLPSFSPEASWYSEALLSSPFLPRKQGDPLAESYTHADGVVGRFATSPAQSGQIDLAHDTRQFLVFEAKMGSGLSSGTKNAPGYDQAARTVACMAHVVGRAPVDLQAIKRFAFYVIAPRQQIASNQFGAFVTKASIGHKVSARAAQYQGEKDAWFGEIFQPALDQIEVALISWETILDSLPDCDEVSGLREFYERCLSFNLK